MSVNDITFAFGSQNGSDLTKTNRAAPSFAIVTSDGNKASYDARIDGNPIGTFKSTLFGYTQIDAPTLADGPHVLTVTETAPQSQSLVPFSFTVDTVAPPKVGPPALASYSQDHGNPNQTVFSNPAFVGTAAPFAAVLLEIDGQGGKGGGVANWAGDWTVRTLGLTSGVHTVTVSQLDTAGNQSPKSDAFTLTVNVAPVVDTVPPTVTSISRTTEVTVMTQLRWSGRDNVGGSGIDRYDVFRNGVYLASATIGHYGDVTGQTGDSYAVEAVDRSGNRSARITIT